MKFDDKIVRAELIGKSCETYNVFLIDIGKHVNVFSDEIFEISNDLKNVSTHLSEYSSYVILFILCIIISIDS